MIDIKILKTTKPYADIEYDYNGELISDDSYDTTLAMALGTDARVTSSEMSDSSRRRGMLVDIDTNSINGSKLWLLSQARLTVASRNRAINYVKSALQFMIDDGLLQNIIVSTSQNNDIMVINITLVRFSGLETNYQYNAWDNSIYKV